MPVKRTFHTCTAAERGTEGAFFASKTYSHNIRNCLNINKIKGKNNFLSVKFQILKFFIIFLYIMFIIYYIMI